MGMLHAWTESEKLSLLHQVVGCGKKLFEVVIKGRTYPAINNMGRRLREQGHLNGLLPKRRLRAWSTREISKLKELTKGGWTARQIYRLNFLPDRTVQSISRMMNRNGLGNPERIQNAKKGHRLTEDQKNELREFLTGEGRTMVTEEVQKKFPVSSGTIRRMRKALGLSLTWQEARQSESWKRAQENSSLAFIESARIRWEQFHAQRRDEFVRLAETISPSHIPRRICQGCGGQWFETTDFYHLTYKKKNGKSIQYFSRRCRICTSAKRRIDRNNSPA